MSINLTAYLDHPSAIAHRVRYARIDNVAVPVWVNVSPNPTTSPAIIATNIDNGQYRIGTTPIYADGRICEEVFKDTPACPELISITAEIQAGNMVVTYIAPSSVPKVRVVVEYPNGGRTSTFKVNDGTAVVIPLPVGLNGDFSVYGQSACDQTTGFYSAASTRVIVNRSASPTLTQVSESNTGPGGTRTQIFVVGSNVSSGNRYVMETYSHPVTVTANAGDTPSTIAVKLRDAINNTTADNSGWNDHGSAPAGGTTGYPPTATASGNQVIVVLDYVHSFTANAYDS